MDALAPLDSGKKSPWRPGESTSAVFEQAAADKAPLTFLTKAPESFPEGISREAQARLRADLKDHWIVAPAKAVALGEKKAFAWWRIDPKSGETVAVTEEGLHGAPAAQYHITHVYVGGVQVGIIITVTVGGTSYTATVGVAGMAVMMRFFLTIPMQRITETVVKF
jgi:hypothetical protein